MKAASLFAIALLASAPTLAQQTNTIDNQTDSLAAVGITFEGSTSRSRGSDVSEIVPDVSVVGTNATAPCVIPIGGGGSISGFGIGFSTGVLDKGCDSRQDATWLLQRATYEAEAGRHDEAADWRDTSTARVCAKPEIARAAVAAGTNLCSRFVPDDERRNLLTLASDPTGRERARRWSRR